MSIVSSKKNFLQNPQKDISFNEEQKKTKTLNQNKKIDDHDDDDDYNEYCRKKLVNAREEKTETICVHLKVQVNVKLSLQIMHTEWQECWSAYNTFHSFYSLTICVVWSAACAVFHV